MTAVHEHTPETHHQLCIQQRFDNSTRALDTNAVRPSQTEFITEFLNADIYILHSSAYASPLIQEKQARPSFFVTTTKVNHVMWVS